MKTDLNLTKQQTNFQLTTLGFNEKYNAFNIVSTIIANMHFAGNATVEFYTEQIKKIAQETHSTPKAINENLTRFFNNYQSTSANKKLTSKSQFNLIKHGNYHRILTIYYTILDVLN